MSWKFIQVFLEVSGNVILIDGSEFEAFCLCIGSEEDVGRVLSDIHNNAVYGASLDQTFPLVIDISETLSVISVEVNAEGSKFTRLTVPILSEFIESGGPVLRLSGDVDIGFAQGRLVGERDNFEFEIELDDREEIGCFGNLYKKLRLFFY